MNFSPQHGGEQAGERPALVLSHRAYNPLRGLAIVCPITSEIKSYPFEVRLPPNVGAHGVVLVDYVKSVDYAARQARRIGQSPKSVLGEVIGKLLPVLGCRTPEVRDTRFR